jgi:hypothetical protein
MHLSTLVIVIIVAVAVLVVIGLIAALMGNRTRMRSLPEDAKRRYAERWRAIQMKFVDNPQAALREADDLAVSVLRERGAHMHDDHMPDELRRAREYARSDEGRTGTEGMRRAMLEYQKIVDDAVGTSERKAGEHRREVA